MKRNLFFGKILLSILLTLYAINSIADKYSKIGIIISILSIFSPYYLSNFLSLLLYSSKSTSLKKSFIQT